MDTENKNTEKLREIKNNFYIKLNVLKNAKDSLLKLFRGKLEEKKIEKIKQNF